MSLAEAMADIALGISSALGGPFHDALVVSQGTPITQGGSIITPAASTTRPCSAQVDKVTERMRNADGYTAKHMGILILAATLDGDMNTDATVQVLGGPHAGNWMVDWIDRDPCGIYWECRGMRAG